MVRSVWAGAQVGGRLILLICESCQRPLEDESVSGRVTYSYSSSPGEAATQVQGREASAAAASCRGAFVPRDLVMDPAWEIN